MLNNCPKKTLIFIKICLGVCNGKEARLSRNLPLKLFLYKALRLKEGNVA